MDHSAALAIAKINQAHVYTVWFGLGGNHALVARATGLDVRVVEALAHDFNWYALAGGKLGLDDKKTEKDINRAVSYAQGDRLAKILNHAIELFEDDNTLRSAIVTTTEDGRQVVTAKPLVELAKALEVTHAIKYRALGDKVAEEADVPGTNGERIKSLSLSVVNLMNSAAHNAKVPTKVVGASLDV